MYAPNNEVTASNSDEVNPEQNNDMVSTDNPVLDHSTNDSFHLELDSQTSEEEAETSVTEAEHSVDNTVEPTPQTRHTSTRDKRLPAHLRSGDYVLY